MARNWICHFFLVPFPLKSLQLFSILWPSRESFPSGEDPSMKGHYTAIYIHKCVYFIRPPHVFLHHSTTFILFFTGSWKRGHPFLHRTQLEADLYSHNSSIISGQQKKKKVYKTWGTSLFFLKDFLDSFWSLKELFPFVPWSIYVTFWNGCANKTSVAILFVSSRDWARLEYLFCVKRYSIFQRFPGQYRALLKLYFTEILQFSRTYRCETDEFQSI